MKDHLWIILVALIITAGVAVGAYRIVEYEQRATKYQACWEDLEAFLFSRSFKEPDMRVNILEVVEMFRQLEHRHFGITRLERMRDVGPLESERVKRPARRRTK